MGRLLRFPSIYGKKGEETDAFKLLRDVAIYIEDKAASQSADLQDFLSSSLLELTKQEQLKHIEDALDVSSKESVPEEARVFSNFLVIRRFLLAYIVKQAGHARERLKTRRREKLEDKLRDVVENLGAGADLNDWDWVSFNENEYELFTALAALANDSTVIFIMNKARPTYLRGSLSMSSKFWNMQEAVHFYRQITDHVLAGEAETAKEKFLEYYEKNDQKILFHYKELKDQD